MIKQPWDDPNGLPMYDIPIMLARMPGDDGPSSLWPSWAGCWIWQPYEVENLVLIN
jgi:hypothetical protein